MSTTANEDAPGQSNIIGSALQDARDQLLKEMKRTKGARFNASKRLEERDRKRTAITAYASAAVIVLTLLPVFFPVPSLLASALNLTTVAFSLVILASSLLQSSSADPVKADQFQRCALEINSLRRDLRSTDQLTTPVLRDYSTRFDDILRRYNLNHDEVDYEKFRLEHADEFPPASTGEAASARKDVKAQRAAYEWLTAVIATATGALAAAVLAASSFGPIVRTVRELIGN